MVLAHRQNHDAAAHLDFLDVSMGFSMPTAKIPWGPGQLREVSKRIRSETGLPGSTSWNITTPRLAEELLQEGAADLVMWPTHSRESALALYRCKRIRSFRPHLPPPDGLRPLACRITLNNECRNGLWRLARASASGAWGTPNSRAARCQRTWRKRDCVDEQERRTDFPVRFLKRRSPI